MESPYIFTASAERRLTWICIQRTAQITDAQLEATGARWSRARREHVLDHVRIHTATPEDAGVTIEKTSIIDGIRVVTLTDLIAIKLLCGLRQPARGRDIGDVQELIRAIPLDKRFAAKLPKSIRPEFKAMVDVVRAGDRSAPPDRRF